MTYTIPLRIDEVMDLIRKSILLGKYDNARNLLEDTIAQHQDAQYKISSDKDNI